jgi:alkanesulfonate monooxygenase SsuD/methylene tetrahydromethanopterin reductase-like flavin-dependent oxidoreductase (luciferase family)
LQDAVCEPKPVQDHLPLFLGGGGEKVTLGIVARHADEWNVWSTPELFRHKVAVLDGHCEKEGRDPSTITKSTQALVFLGEDEEWLAKRRSRSTGRPEIIGTPDEVVEIVADYRDSGVDELIIPDWTMGTGARRADTLDLFQRRVAVHF